jgi:hypothetical protein
MMARKKLNSIWPLPVYVATFANGETARLSFGSPLGKPLDFARGRRMVCHAARDWQNEPGAVTTRGHWTNDHPYYATPPRADIVDGRVEVDGDVFRDPHFMPAAPVVPLARGSKTPTRAAYARVLAMLPELTTAQLDELAAAVAETLNEKIAA